MGQLIAACCAVITLAHCCNPTQAWFTVSQEAHCPHCSSPRLSHHLASRSPVSMEYLWWCLPIVIAMLSRNCKTKTLSWDLNMKPSIHRISLDYEGVDQYIELLLSSAPVVKVANIEFKRQLFTSQTLVDHSQISLRGHAIKIQQSRFSANKQLDTFNNFMTRLDLDYEFNIAEHTTFTQCMHKCQTLGTRMPNSLDQLDQLEALTPAYPGRTWIITGQKVDSKSMYDIKYEVFFDAIPLLLPNGNNGFNTTTLVFQPQSNGACLPIDQLKIASRADYYDPSGNTTYYKYEPYFLEVSIDNRRHINVYIPVYQGSKVPVTMYARCVCLRNLELNKRAARQAALSVNSTLGEIEGAPSEIELYRVKAVSPESLSSIEHMLSSDIKVFNGKRFLATQDLHPLHIWRPNNFSVNDDTFLPSTMHHGYEEYLKNMDQKQKRGIPLSMGVSLAFKVAQVSSPYLFSVMGSPLTKLYNKAADAMQIDISLNKNFSNVKAFQKYLEDKYMNSPIKIQQSGDRFNILLANVLPQLTSLDAPDLDLAETVKRAASSLSYFRDVTLSHIPNHIMENIALGLDYEISTTNPALCTLFHAKTFIIYDCQFEVIRSDLSETYVALTSLPHKVISGDFVHFGLSGDQVVELGSFGQNWPQLVGQKECLSRVLSTSPQKFKTFCEETVASQHIVTPLHVLKLGTLYQILGDTTLSLSCNGKIGENMFLSADINLLYVSHACELKVAHGNLRQTFPKTSKVTANMSFALLLKYNVTHHNGFKSNTLLWLGSLSATCATLLLFCLAFICLALYYKRKYNPTVVPCKDVTNQFEVMIQDPIASKAT